MAVQDELEYLKSLVTQLNEKIHNLEAKAKDAVSGSKTPAQQLRTILVGPPGAGECIAVTNDALYDSLCLIMPNDSQERVLRPPKFGMSSVSATLPPVTCFATRSRGRRSSVWRRRRSWMPVDSSAMISSWA